MILSSVDNPRVVISFVGCISKINQLHCIVVRNSVILPFADFHFRVAVVDKQNVLEFEVGACKAYGMAKSNSVHDLENYVFHSLQLKSSVPVCFQETINRT